MSFQVTTQRAISPKRESPNHTLRVTAARDSNEPIANPNAHDYHPEFRLQSAFPRPSSISPDQSNLPYEFGSRRQSHQLLEFPDRARHRSRSPASPQTWMDQLQTSWVKNKGLGMVIVSQFFGVGMNVITRMLEQDSMYGPKMQPFQVLFVRMIGTLTLSFTYQWLARVRDAPFGPREVRDLLIVRGIGGFFGVYGMYYSLIYLNLSDATVITFLAPVVSCYATSILIKEPFTRAEQISAVLSFLGVVLIAHPTSLIPGSPSKSPTVAAGTDSGLSNFEKNGTAPSNISHGQQVTSRQRLGAVGVALIGVFGAACAYTTIRWIGQRAHPLISVNYFAVWSAFVSTLALFTIPSIDFQLPAGWVQWMQLIVLGTFGFIMQFLLTAGLAYEKSSRATNMVYTQMLFALALDKLIWNSTPSLTSIIGSSLILGSALYVAILNNSSSSVKGSGNTARSDEETLILEGDAVSDGSERE